MCSDSKLVSKIHELIKQQLPSSLKNKDLNEELPLMQGGLGIDSIKLVDLLLSCEDIFGSPFTPDILEEEPLTVKKLIEYVKSTMKTSRR